jgi:hypothetical protein
MLPLRAPAAVIINEIQYDDGGGADDREYVELYNNGLVTEAIGGWTLGGQDEVGANTSTTITAGTMLAPGAYYVVGQTGVLNVNQVVGAVLENDSETVELRNGAVLVDAVLYEANKGPGDGPNPPGTSTQGHGVLPAAVSANVGPGIWGNNQSSDIGAAPGTLSSGSLGRFVDGRDTDNNGRDFGYRPNTPGTSNNPTNITEYVVPNVNATAVGTNLGGHAYAFAPPRVIDPAVADANNPNAIGPVPGPATRAIVAWDPAGGGNAVSAAETFNTSESKFDIFAYFDTRNIPQNSNASGQLFRGSEITIYGIGSTEALSNLTDISGQVGVADSANGTTGIAWVYEKVGETNANPGVVSEKLYLVDANDGGDAGQGGSVPFNWTILATIDLSSSPSDWYRLSIEIDALGNGVARFEQQTFNFVTGQHSGAFNVGYRENTQLGTDGTPDAILRPPTYAMVPEPATFGLALLVAAAFAITLKRN